jgi:16S rRNA (cytidine1402-2'-O)-methyltransferase
MPNLYVVATPIGNLEDITQRALRVLGEVSLIACEDTRHSRRLLTHYGIKTPTTSYHGNNRTQKIPMILQALETADVALVSDGGTPVISDPGRELVAAVWAAGHRVSVLPGPSAVTAALSVSGLGGDRYLFLGFLPPRSGERRRRLEAAREEPGSLVMLEAPHRVQAALKDILKVLGDREIAVCREMTKVYEEVFRGSVSQAIAHFAAPLGEFTLVVAGGNPVRPTADAAATDEVDQLIRAGQSARDAIQTVAQVSGIPRREVYRAWLEKQGTK